MSFELLSVAFVSFILGVLIGRRSSDSAKNTSVPDYAERVNAYKEIFDAFVLADEALTTVSVEEGVEGQLSDDKKQAVWDSIKTLNRVFSRVRFLLPQDINIAMDELRDVGHLGISWSKRLDELRRIKEAIYTLARKDVGVDQTRG